MREFQEYLTERLSGLVATVDSPSRFEICSGMVVCVDDSMVLLTVAHFLKSVESWNTHGRLADLVLTVHDGLEGVRYVKLNLEDVELRWDDHVDVGCLVLNNEVAEKFCQFGGKIVMLSQVAQAGDTHDQFILVGHPSSKCPIRREIIATDAERQWQLEQSSGVAVVTSPLQFVGQGEESDKLRFAPRSGLDDYSGASGGPVFGYKDGAPMKEYSLVGIQSKQILAATADQKPKELIAVSGAAATSALTKLLGGSPR